MSEIKSERAREIIETCHRIVPCYSSKYDEWHDTEDTDAIDKSDAIKAIIKAESDARDRAVRAFCECCSVPECPRDWKEGDYFRACQNAPAEYLKAYDNE